MKADWSNGVWTTGDSIHRDESNVRLTLTSDWLPLRAYEEIVNKDPLAVYGDLLPLLQESDRNIINVECTLGSNGQQVGYPILKAGPNFQAVEESIRSLTEVPFHIACLANNHIMDYGPESLGHTIDLLQQAGLQTVGAGMTGEQAAQPLVMDIKGTKVAIINCAEGEACRSVANGPGAYGFELHEVAGQIQQLKPVTDAIIVVFHGGREYTPLPPEYVISGLRGIALAGATAVIAHHPHVPQGIEIYEGVPIVYSQGNFVFWQDRLSYYNHCGYMVHLNLSQGRLVQMEITPYLIEQTGLTLMNGKQKTHFLHSLQIVSDLLAQPDAVRSAWNAFVDSTGIEGIKRSLKAELNSLETNLEASSARLLNWFFTPAHSEFYINGLRRASTGELGNSPEWAKQLVRHWFSFPLEEGKAAYEHSSPLTEFFEKTKKTAAE